jgi:hypothetical protein
MGNILNTQSDPKLINHLNKKDHQQLEEFKLRVKLGQSNASLFTVYEYQKTPYRLKTDFILCKSSSVDEIIENILNGDESIAHLSWDTYDSHYDYNGKLYIKDLFMNPKISRHSIDLIEIHAHMTSKICKTLRRHPSLKNQDDQSSFNENNIIDGIIINFIVYPISKILLLTEIMIKYNLILDIKSNILNRYIRTLYHI